MIQIKDVTKVYRASTAVDRISLEIKEGEIFGLVGPNGAGKTTLILMLSTLLEPTSGTAIIGGKDVLKKPHLVKKDIGILFQETSLDGKLTGRENLDIHAVLHDVPKNMRLERVDEMLDFVGLKEWGSVPVKRYSGGMKRRLEIARSLLHRPKILLLDEPTLGLDPTAREVIWQYIKKLENMTIMVATNYIEEAERLCDRIAIIDLGKVVALGSSDELKASLKMDLARIKAKSLNKIEIVLKGLPYVDDIKIDGSEIVFVVEENRRSDLLSVMTSYDLDSFEIHKPTLRDVFMRKTGRSIDVPMARDLRKRGLRRRRR